MKIKSLLLGSVAAAGLSTGAYAADLDVLTSLDVCDSLGISGLTISSDTNCLQITGEVSYEFEWGDYAGGVYPADYDLPAGGFNIDADDDDGDPDNAQDWTSDLDSWITFAGTSNSDFGPAKAVLTLKYRDKWDVVNEGDPTINGDSTGNYVEGDPGEAASVVADEAYVSVGDSTVIMAGIKGSIINDGDDEPFNFLGLYNSDEVDPGVEWGVDVDDGGHVIQAVSDLGNGVSVGAGLEDLAGNGTLVGTVGYAGETVSAHGTIIGNDILTADIASWAYHAGFTANVQQFAFRAALAGDDTGYWNALASGEANFDMFTLAASVEAADDNYLGFGGSAGANVTDGVAINIGARWADNNTDVDDDEIWQAAIQVVADVTETITVTGELGLHGRTDGSDEVTYGEAELAWAPGGGFESTVGAELNSEGAYKFSYTASKSFE